jgi:hypothetical protein
MTAEEREELINVIRPAGAHDFWPQAAADLILSRYDLTKKEVAT